MDKQFLLLPIKRKYFLMYYHTYRDKHAVSILKFFSFVTNNVRKALHVVDSDDADVVVEAKGLNEGEMDLQSNVTLEVISGQKAEGHAVRVPVKTKVVLT